MTVTVKIPAALRGYTDRKAEIALEATTVGEAITRLAADHPDARPHLLDEDGNLRPFVNVFVGGKSVKGTGGLSTPLEDGAQVTLVPAIAGGSGRDGASR